MARDGVASQVTDVAPARGEEVRPSLLERVGPQLARLRAFRLGGLWLATALVMLIFWLGKAAFLSGTNLLDLVRSGSSLAIVALGETVVIICGELDLSIGSVYALSSIVLAVLWMNAHISIYVAIPLALLSGMAIGVMNGFFTVATRIPSFVVTLGTLSIAAGLTVEIGKAAFYSPVFTTPPLPPAQVSFFHNFGGSAPGGIPAQVLWLIAGAVVFALVLHRSLWGFRLAAIGGNPDAARVARLPVRKYRFYAFVISGFTAALAGIIDFSFLGSTQPSSAGSNLTFPVFAAVIIGGASLSGGSGTVIGTLSGALLLQVLSNGLAINGIGGGAQEIFTGAVTIIAVGIDRWSQLAPLARERIRLLRGSRKASAGGPGLGP